MRRLAAATVAVVAAVVPAAVVPASGRGPAPRSGLAVRLLGPVAGLAAGVEWVRADLAWGRGRDALGLRRATRALALDPRSTGGWSLLARWQAVDLASPEREPDAGRRRAAIEAARATIDAAVERAAEPAELRALEGLLLGFCAERDPELGWPGGAAALWTEAARAFDAAARDGHAEAGELAEAARAAAGSADAEL